MLDYRIVNMFCFKATKPSIRMTQPELPVCRPFEPQDTNHCSDGAVEFENTAMLY